MIADKTKQPADRSTVLRDAVTLGGFSLLTAGVAAFDWRLGCVVAGVVMLTAGIVGMFFASRRHAPRKK